MSIENIIDLTLFIEKIFQVKISEFKFEVNKNLPKSLQQIYMLDAFFAKYDCKYEPIRFFRNMDILTNYEDLKLDEEQFVFATENQGNWFAKTSLHSDKVFIYNHEEIIDNTALPEPIEEFLITFALLEISNNCNHFVGLYDNFVDKVKRSFKKIEPLWIDKKYLLRNTSFFLIDQDILFDEANMTLASNNQEKLNYYTSKLATYKYN